MPRRSLAESIGSSGWIIHSWPEILTQHVAAMFLWSLTRDQTHRKNKHNHKQIESHSKTWLSNTNAKTNMTKETNLKTQHLVARLLQTQTQETWTQQVQCSWKSLRNQGRIVKKMKFVGVLPKESVPFVNHSLPSICSKSRKKKATMLLFAFVSEIWFRIISNILWTSTQRD